MWAISDKFCVSQWLIQNTNTTNLKFTESYIIFEWVENQYKYKQITIPMIEVSFYYLLLPEGKYWVWYNNNILVLHTIITSSSNNFWQ